MRSVISIFVSLVLLLVGCGSTTTEVADTTSSTVEETTTTSTTEATTTSTAAPTSADDPLVIDYCDARNEAETVVGAADFNDPVHVEEAIQFQLDTITAIEAPAVIETDLATMVATTNRYFTLLGTADYDLLVVEDELNAIFEEPDVVAAIAALDAFEAEFCRISVQDDVDFEENPLGLTENDVIELLADPAGRAGIVEGMVGSTSMTIDEANCFLDETDPAVVAALFSIGVGEQTTVAPNVSAGMLAGLDACGLSIELFG